MDIMFEAISGVLYEVHDAILSRIGDRVPQPTIILPPSFLLFRKIKYGKYGHL